MTPVTPAELRRLLVLLVAAGVWIVVLLGRLVYLQVARSDDFRAVLLKQLEQHQQLQAAAEASRHRLGMRSAQTLLAELNSKLQRLDTIPIAELRDLLRDTSSLIVITNAESQALEIQNSQLEAALQSKKGVIEDYNRELTRLQKLTSEERRMIQTLLGDVVQRESEKSFWLGVLLSFPIGVIASVIAGLFQKHGWLRRLRGGT